MVGATLAKPQATTEPARFYLRELDALRAFAFLSVFLSHYFMELGWSPRVIYILGHGVDLFFTLSAYLITELLLREKDRFGHIDIKGFYIRRILRIWPLYFAFLAFVLLLKVIAAPRGIPYSVLTLFAVFLGDTPGSSQIFISPILFPLWSISLEEQFYLTWPHIRAKDIQTPSGSVRNLFVGTLHRDAAAILSDRRGPCVFSCAIARRLHGDRAGDIQSEVAARAASSCSVGCGRGLLDLFRPIHRERLESLSDFLDPGALHGANRLWRVFAWRYERGVVAARLVGISWSNLVWLVYLSRRGAVGDGDSLCVATVRVQIASKLFGWTCADDCAGGSFVPLV
jgi:Acyltransferase family